MLWTDCIFFTNRYIHTLQREKVAGRYMEQNLRAERHKQILWDVSHKRILRKKKACIMSATVEETRDRSTEVVDKNNENTTR